ncbi:MAG: hypothetical protein WEA29_06900 [Acidimicrobiia bacterium]
MSESLDAFAELQAIRSRLDGIEHRQEMLVRAQAEEILAAIWTIMDNDPMLAPTYLLVDGSRTQQQIAKELRQGGHPASDASISRKLKRLRNDLGLVELLEHTAAGKAYGKSALDRILNLTPKVEKRVEARTKARAKPKKTKSSG